MEHSIFIDCIVDYQINMSMIFQTNKYPVVLLGMDEPNYYDNLEQLLKIHNDPMQVREFEGSDYAHKIVAQKVREIYPDATHVVIIDGDNHISPNFFTRTINFLDSVDLDNHVLSYSAVNNINGNCYGNGGIKIWPLKVIEAMRTHENSSDPDSVDFDLTKYIELNSVGSTTVINSSPLQAWRAGIREGYKLCLENNKPIKDIKQMNWRNYDRLWRWIHVGADVENGLWAIYGARLGMCLALVSGYDNSVIRDFNKLNSLFEGSPKDKLLEECVRLGKLIKDATKDSRITDVLSITESKEFRERVKPILRSQENFIQYKYHPPYDVVFISYNEPYADANYEALLAKCPGAKRVNGVDGIHKAHIEAAKLCSSDYFWVVDADAELVDNFEFEYQIDFHEQEAVRVWRSKNPVNDLIYGNGGVKLLPRAATARMSLDKPDMTTSICDLYYPIIKVSNVTRFNADPFTTWRSAFRECTKLASQVIDRQNEADTLMRLDTWCTVGEDKPFGKYAIDGAKLGREYGTANKGNLDALKLINDYAWLKEQYDKFH